MRSGWHNQSMSILRTICTILTIAMLNACATETRVAAPQPQNPINTRAWQCEQTGYVVSSLGRDSDSLWLFLPQATLQLDPVGPGLYAAAGVSLSIDGLQSELTRDGVAETCTENRRLSIREDAKLRGVDFWATGNEPPWRLEMSPDLILLKTGYENERHEFPPVDPETEPENRRSTWTTAINDEQLTIEIEGKDCRDSMSGDPFSATVRVNLNGRELLGCGTALH